MWHLQIWLSGGLGSTVVTVGLYHLRDLFLLKKFYGPLIL